MGSTFVHIATSAGATLPSLNENLSLTQLRHCVLELLTAQRGVALNTKEICRRLNKIRERSFCHTVNDESVNTVNLTAKSYSKLRGCFMSKTIPCRVKIRDVWKALHQLLKLGKIKMKRGRGLDRRISAGRIQISTDRYVFWFVDANPFQEKET